MTEFGEKAEIKTYPFESFGQVIKISAELPPDAFPHKVAIPLGSDFFKSVYNRVYRGFNTTSQSSGVSIEREAIVGADDLGNLMISNEVFEGTPFVSLTKQSEIKMNSHTNFLKSTPFPLGWRTFGLIHSHPIYDLINNVGFCFLNYIPRINGVPITWSFGDFKSFLHEATLSHSGFTTMAVITQTQLSFMVASNVTVEMIRTNSDKVEKMLNSDNSVPPYKLFEEYGVVLYGGNHFGNQKGEMLLQRLI